MMWKQVSSVWVSYGKANPGKFKRISVVVTDMQGPLLDPEPDNRTEGHY